MACPHYSVRDNECLLAQDQPEDEEQPLEAPAEEPVNLSWCLGEGDGFRNCPLFRKFVADIMH